VLVGPAIRRVLASACVAGGLGLVFWLVLYIGWSRFTDGGTCGGAWGLGCLGVAIIAGLAGILAFIVLAWPLLHAARVRPAWPVALLGPVISFVTYYEYVKLVGGSLVTGLWIVLLAVSYAAAAVITAPRLYRYWSAAIAMAVIAMDLAMRHLPGR